MRLLLASVAVLWCGCRFDVPGFSPDGMGADASLDATVGDASSTAFVPSHVVPSDVSEGAASLSVMMDIDTDALAIDGRTPMPGILFHPEESNPAWAVLAVHDFTVTNDIKVHGSRALIVIAVGTIEIDAIVHAEAILGAPGPGGDFTGMGVGSDGKSSGGDDSGGGGAGHATAGATGGESTAKNNGQGGAAGAAYGSTDDLVGGSGGGTGSGATSGQTPCPTGGATWSVGGAGGGTLQLSAQLQLRVSSSGGINAGGGGGSGGCKEAASAGGGGGSGGTIWVEAPTMTIDGTLAANGGGGGSGGDGGGIGVDGTAGSGGLLAVTVAAGGASSGSSSGAGGTGGAGTTVPTTGGQATNGGGGGGAVGNIRIRTHAVSPITSASTVLSPAPLASVDF